MPVDIVIQRTLTFSDYDINMIFVTALEGGIGYWSQCENYDPDNTTVTIYDFVASEEGDAEQPVKYEITADTIKLGLTRLLNGNFVRPDILEQFQPGDDLDVDSDGADCVIQLALFNELRYG